MSYTGYGNSGFDLDSPGQVSTFDQKFTGASGAYDDYNPKPQTYDKIFETHPKGHLQLKKDDTSVEDHRNSTSNHALDFLKNSTKNLGSFIGNEKEVRFSYAFCLALWSASSWSIERGFFFP